MSELKQTERQGESEQDGSEYVRPEIFELGNATDLTRGFWVGAYQETVDPYARKGKIC